MLINLKREVGLRKDGIYKLQVESVEERQGQKGAYISMRIRFVDFPNAQAILENLSFSPGARFRMEQFLNAINAPKKGTLSTKALVGKTFVAEVSNESYTDQHGSTRLKNKVTNYLPADTETTVFDESDEDDDDDLDNGSIASFGGVTTGYAEDRAERAAALDEITSFLKENEEEKLESDDDDDLPF